MNIGEAARRSGISSKMIRHYEQLGLIAPIGRSEAGYRVFSERDLGLLRFIRKARSLGFSLEQIGQLVLLWQDEARASLDVKRVAERHLADLDAKIRAKSGGKRKLDDLLAPMFVSREKGAAFDHEAWKAMVGGELGPDAVATFEKVVLGGEMFVPDAGAFGPCFTREPAAYDVGGVQVQGYRWVRLASVPDAVCRGW